MASQFGPSSLHQRDPRSALFEGYQPSGSIRSGSNGPSRANPARAYEYGGNGNLSSDRPAYRPATPNSKYVMLENTLYS